MIKTVRYIFHKANLFSRRCVGGVQKKIKEDRNDYSVFPDLLNEVLLESKNNTINVVQVGANDGKINDPINRFLIENKEYTKALLVEPQLDIISVLEQTYKCHPNVRIFHGAVGNKSQLTLFRIKPAFWPFYEDPFFEKTPSYRAPSGITSSDRKFVIRNIKEKLNCSIPIEEVMEEIHVSCRSVESLVDTYLDGSVDIVQVDTEGGDDEVIYSCNLRKLQPFMIHYEYKHLGAQKDSDLENYLTESGYDVLQSSRSDKVAVLRSE